MKIVSLLILLALLLVPPCAMTVRGAAPTAVLEASPSNPDVGDVVIFDAHRSDPGSGEKLWFKFDAGDGTVTDWTSSGVWSHAYSKKGKFVARVMVKNEYNETDEATVVIKVGKEETFFGMTYTSFVLLIAVIALIIGAIVLLLRRRKHAGEDHEAHEEYAEAYPEEYAEALEEHKVMVTCPNCGNVMEITYTETPVIVTCDRCGMVGEIPEEMLEG